MWFQQEYESHALSIPVSTISAELPLHAPRRHHMVSQHESITSASGVRSAAVDLRPAVSDRLQ
jgi:hypothetical protein